ncbi:hypothetical protein C3L23_09075 [Nautilia sp. PV-1]|nr:hypothetical protein C3L23_09075 [Nautilia sp. PV-1]
MFVKYRAYLFWCQILLSNNLTKKLEKLKGVTMETLFNLQEKEPPKKIKKEKTVNVNLEEFVGDFIIMFSGGKDSTAVLLFVLNHIRKYNKKNRIRILFFDTKWEHEYTYQYLTYIEKKLGLKIERIETEGMKNLCVRKKRIPRGLVSRFCTKELKIIPFKKWLFENYIQKGKKAGKDFIIVQGIRAEESDRRAERYDIFNVKNFEIEKHRFKVIYWNAIFTWTKEQVFNYIKQNGLKLNPLYTELGMERVGCFPCVSARTVEIKAVAADDKYRKRVFELEEAVNKVRNGKKMRFFVEKEKQRLIDEAEKTKSLFAFAYTT